jgi:hypothetical protein
MIYIKPLSDGDNQSTLKVNIRYPQGNENCEQGMNKRGTTTCYNVYEENWNARVEGSDRKIALVKKFELLCEREL